MSEQPEKWDDYPAPHYDDDDDCQCPDHVAQREELERANDPFNIRQWLLGGT